ncbi:PML [Mytilus edulis]|uniref:PML n=1 Tax=Mytilus edulis TaxID=6550 RepID=A0A8S3S8Q9_MYTED|nr:PML [Mytilus edulis]
METPAKILCGICDSQHVTKSADFWCPECDDGLCTECKTHHSFSKASRHHDVSLKCSNNEEIEILFKSIKSLGFIANESSSPSVQIKLEKNKQAQILTDSFIPKSIDNVFAKFVRKFQIPIEKSNRNNTSGCAIFPNGKIIFADCGVNMRLVIFNTDGSLDYEIPLSRLRPFDVACVDDKTLAFTVWESSEIHLLT